MLIIKPKTDLTGLLIILLLIFNQHGGPPYSVSAAQAIYRLSFVFIWFCSKFLLRTRFSLVQNLIGSKSSLVTLLPYLQEERCQRRLERC